MNRSLAKTKPPFPLKSIQVAWRTNQLSITCVLYQPKSPTVGGRVYELWSDANSTAQQWVAAIQEVIRLCLSHKENTLETNETGSLKLL